MNETREIIDVGHGDPLIFNRWWRDEKILPEIATDISESLYTYQQGEDSDLIRATHNLHGRFGTDCETASIVYGNGSIQVLNAVLYAISRRLNRTIVVGYELPIYMLMHEFLCNSTWITVTQDLTRTDIDVEIVIDPNNPTGESRTNKSTATYTIFDRAYNWPIYLEEETPLKPTSAEPNHIAIYTISKALGMGGLRLGWGFINDDVLSQEVSRALVLLGICPSSFGMTAAKQVFRKFVGSSRLVMSYSDNLRDQIRWNHECLKSCQQFTIVNSAGPFAWIQSKDGSNIAETLLTQYSIKVYGGEQFGSTTEFARFSLICDENDFSEALARLLL